MTEFKSPWDGMTTEEIKAWWERWTIDHAKARAERQASYAIQKAEAIEKMKNAQRKHSQEPGMP
jgi:hypothetical protein